MKEEFDTAMKEEFVDSIMSLAILMTGMLIMLTAITVCLAIITAHLTGFP